MNFLKKGPEIKLPSSLSDVKVPGFVKDAYYELDERHLIPLVIVLVVAIIAVPIALSESTEPNPAAGTSVQTGEQAAASSIIVSKSLPGLRDYHKRLDGLRSKDPFKQQFTDAEEAGASGGGATVEGETPITESAGGGTEESSGTPHVTHEVKYFSWSIDVRITPVSTNGKPSNEKPTVRRNLPELTMLPGRDTPAAIFMGPSADRKHALMLVSSNVTGTFGDATCVLGGETCEMLALEEGVPETFVYGGNQRIFKIELLKIELAESNSLHRAPLGQQGGSGGKQPPAAERAAVERSAVAQPK
jgi:hypothetical protein